MSWNRTGGTLMQSSGEFRLSEPRSTALIEAATRGDRSGVFILIGQGSWVEQCDAMSENGAFGCRTGQCTPARWLELPRLTRRDRGLRPFCPLACIGLVSHACRRDAAGYTALLRLAGHGDVASVKRLLQVGADTEARNLVRLDRLQWLCRPHVPHTHAQAPSETCPCVHTPCLRAARQHGHDARCGEEPIPRHRGIAGCAR